MGKKIAWTVLAFVCLALVWVRGEIRHAQAVRPPPGATNLNAFLQTGPKVARIQRFTVGDRSYIEVVGRPPLIGLSLPSGPPAYVFDESGTLLDWAGDTGEATHFNEKWRGRSNLVPLTVEEAKARDPRKVETNRPTPPAGAGP